MLYLGALGDRYGRKLMLLLGMALVDPGLPARRASRRPTTVLFVARLLGGVAAGMAYPTTLALITALWSGPARTKSIALWSALGGAIAALGPLLSGALLEQFGGARSSSSPCRWRSSRSCWPGASCPAHVNETTEPVDNLGGVLSVAAGRRRWSSRSTSRRCPNEGDAGGRARRRSRWPRGVAFVIRQRRAANPLYDLDVAAPARSSGSRRCAGIIVFGSLMGGDVHRPAVPAERARLLDARRRARDPARRRAAWSLVAPRSAKLVEARGARFTLLVGYVFCLLGFLDDAAALEGGHLRTGRSASATRSIGIGVGFAGTPASHSLTGSVPVRRAGMASGTADLQRDLGGAIMQSIFGALLTAGYAAARRAAIAAAPDSERHRQRRRAS